MEKGTTRPPDEDFEGEKAPSSFQTSDNPRRRTQAPRNVKRPIQRTVDSDDDDEEAHMPTPKRAKRVAPKQKAQAEPKAPKPAPTPKSTKTTSDPKVTTKSPARESTKPSEEPIAAPANTGPISSFNPAAQYSGIPLEHLRAVLTPQEYIRVSILRSMSESAHAGIEKNVSRKLHPDLARPRASLNFDSELRAMISTWVELVALSGSCLELLEEEATRYMTILLRELQAVVNTHMESGIVNNRALGTLNYTNQAQMIKANLIRPRKMAKPVSTETAPAPVEPPIKEEKAANSDSKVDENINSEKNEDENDDSSEYEESEEGENAAQSDDEGGAPRSVHLNNSFATAKVPKYSRVPIASMDHVAEVLVARHISLVRRLEYIALRLAEDDRTQRVNKESVSDKVRDVDESENDEEEEAFEVWRPSLELDAYIRSQDASETTEKQAALRETILEERMERVRRIAVADLEDWQTASSVSLARPNLAKFKAWLAVCCDWDPASMCIPSHLTLTLNYVLYEHLRYIVRCAVTKTSDLVNGSKTELLALVPESLRAEIVARAAIADAVHTHALATS